jgi:flavin reductase ActVB
MKKLMHMTSLDDNAYRAALGSFPSGVTIVSTTDAEGRHWGFTASSFTSVSMSPPLVLVCLAERADSHPAFVRATRFAINVLAQEQKDVALHFSRKGTDKFHSQDFRFGTSDEPRPPVLRGSSAVLICETHDIYHLGDHAVLIGEVRQVETSSHAPLVYCNRDFWNIERATADLNG